MRPQPIRESREGYWKRWFNTTTLKKLSKGKRIEKNKRRNVKVERC
jgi:hypothetical protein